MECSEHLLGSITGPGPDVAEMESGFVAVGLSRAYRT